MALWKGSEKTLEGPALSEVQSLLTKAVTLDPQCADAYLQLGNLSASRRDYEKAIEYYKESIAANTQLAEAHYRLAIAYDRVSKHDLAKQEFQRHDEIRKAQAAEVDKERREVKQFLVVTPESQTRPNSPQ
jgi:tetratricopeptide (TPR) repeat protein